jgi:CPA2 family monovalent cation:H+ antiporter-2
MHEMHLITTIAAAFALAFLFGVIAAKLRMPPLAGYLVAGMLIGPHTRGYVADVALASQLAEIGVMLLMFGVGLHFSIEDLASVRKLVLPGAVLQICFATTLGAVTAHTLWSWPLGASIVFGLALSVASTVVLLRALESRNAVETFNGRIAVGWLIVQDVVMVLVLVLLPPLAGILGGAAPGGSSTRGVAVTLLLTFAKVAAFVLLMVVAGKRLFPRILWLVAKTGSRELFTLCVIAAAVGVAYGAAALFGVSFALGAFFAGMMMRESAFSHRAADESLPLRDAFAVLFFVSVGMLFDPSVLVRTPFQVLVVLGIIVVGNTLAAFTIVLLFRYPLNTALMVGAGLAQIGEFSFILARLGVDHNLLPDEGQSLILAGAILSIALNPAVFALTGPAQRWVLGRSDLARRLTRRVDPLSELPASVDSETLTGHVVIVGYGRVGSRIAAALQERGISLTIAEQSREVVERLRAQGVHAVSGDASDPAVLIQAHVARASLLVIATPDTIGVRRMIQVARALNPGIRIVLRTHSDDEARMLQEENAGQVFMGEHELARSMTAYVLDEMKDRVH